MKQQNLLKTGFQTIFLYVHIISLFILIMSPLFVSKNFIKKYGRYISSTMVLIMITWIIFEKCPLGIFEGGTKYGSFIKFISLYINVNGYENIINLMLGFWYSCVLYFYSRYSRPILYFVIVYNIYELLKFFLKYN